MLTFLSYREKYLAGSWRFDTYFGRDTMMSLTLLAPVLQHLVQRDVWSRKAPPMFVVTLPDAEARAQVKAYAAAVGVDATKPLSALEKRLLGKPLSFNALSLDENGKPIPVMRSDPMIVTIL